MCTYHGICIHPMTLVSTRIPEDIEKELAWYAKKEQVGRAIALRKILDRGLKEIKREHAIELYAEGKVTLWKAAEIAGLSLWEMLDIVRERRIPVKYTVRDTEKDLEIARMVGKKVR